MSKRRKRSGYDSREAKAARRRAAGIPERKFQVPGQPWTFVHDGQQDSGVLPSAHGLSNDFAMWQIAPNRKYENGHATSYKNGGSWVSRLRTILTNSRSIAARRGIMPIGAGIGELRAQWANQRDTCIACTRPLLFKDAHAHHNHKTGRFAGFVCNACNWVEGLLDDMSHTETEKFFTWYRESEDRS